MKIEIQASGESQREITAALRCLTDRISDKLPPDVWHVLVGTAQASAVVVKEEVE